MPIIVLPDVIMPQCVIAAGISGKQLRRNARTENQGGYMSANIIWQNTLRQYELGIIPMLVAQWQALESVFEVTDGGAYGFLLQDPKDSSAAAGSPLQPYAAGGNVGAAGVGFGVPVLRLARTYTVASRSKLRRISRPKGAPVLRRGGVVAVAGPGAGQYAIDPNTGAAAFVADATASVTAVTVGATTTVTLSGALAGLPSGGRLWLQGLTGADAALLNNQSHAITGLAGAVYTLATNTAGKTINAAGQGHKYPQASEAMTWSGAFYVPVQFMSDEIDWQMARPGHEEDRLIAGPSVMLMEVRE